MQITGPTKPRASLGWVLVLTAAAALVVALDQLVVATALQRIRADLGASMSSLEWTVNAFSLSFAALLLPASDLGDRLGHKRVYLTGLIVFAVASASCALAPDVGVLIAARVIQGAGAALISPASLTLLTRATPVAKRGAAMGLYAAVMGLAVVGGPLVGGAVAQGIAWQWIFWINLPVIALVLPLAAVKLGEVKGTPSGPDPVGLLLSAASMCAIVWALVRSGPAGWSSTEVLGTLIGGGVLLMLFIGWELRRVEPMLPVRIFANREFAAANVSALLLTASLFGTVFFLAQYLQVGLGYSPLDAGLRFLPWTVLLFIVAPLAGRFQDRVGARRLISVGLLLQGLGMGWIAVTAHQHESYGATAVGLVISGFGTSLAMPAQQATAMSSTPSSSMGRAAGTFNVLRQVGGALGIAVLAAVFAAHGSDRTPTQFASGFAAAMVAAGVLAGLGALCALFVPTRPGRTDAGNAPEVAVEDLTIGPKENLGVR